MIEAYIIGAIITLLIIAPAVAKSVYKNLSFKEYRSVIEDLAFFMIIPLIWPIVYVVALYTALY